MIKSNPPTIKKDKSKTSLKKETEKNKTKNAYNPWKPIVDKVSIKIITPFEIKLSTLSSLSSIAKNIIHNPSKKKENKVNKCITSWDNKLEQNITSSQHQIKSCVSIIKPGSQFKYSNVIGGRKTKIINE